MRRSVKSYSEPVPVDAHERTRDYTHRRGVSCAGGRDPSISSSLARCGDAHAHLHHGLRVSELCHLQCKDIELKYGRLWVGRVKGSLSTEQPLLAEELRALKRYLKERSDSQLPWLFLTERRDQFTRFSINYLVRTAGRRAGLALK
jgi:type 1 fimbriae regulatory protein FimB